MTMLSLTCADFQGKMTKGLLSMLESEQYANVTIAVEGKRLEAHQLVLSICSPYFHELLQSNPSKHPIIFMKNVKYNVMKQLLRFMYEGETEVDAECFESFIDTAQELQIKWLMNINEENKDADIKTTLSSPRAQKRPLRSNAPDEPIQHTIPSDKRPKITIMEDLNACKSANDIDVTVEKSNNGSINTIADASRTAEIVESPTNTNHRFFVEPIDRTLVMDECYLDYSEGLQQETFVGDGDTIEIDDDDDAYEEDEETDELLQPMEETRELSSVSSGLQPVDGQPVTVSYYKRLRLHGSTMMVGNYTYSKHYDCQLGERWRCSKRQATNRSSACSAVKYLTHDRKITFIRNHNHAPATQRRPLIFIKEETYIYSAKQYIRTRPYKRL